MLMSRMALRVEALEHIPTIAKVAGMVLQTKSLVAENRDDILVQVAPSGAGVVGMFGGRTENS